MNVDENLTAENIVSNDVTAIDAVTGDAANMAADVNYTETATISVDTTMPTGNAAKPAGQAAPRQAAACDRTRRPAARQRTDNATE